MKKERVWRGRGVRWSEAGWGVLRVERRDCEKGEDGSFEGGKEESEKMHKKMRGRGE